MRLLLYAVVRKREREGGEKSSIMEWERDGWHMPAYTKENLMFFSSSFLDVFNFTKSDFFICMVKD